MLVLAGAYVAAVCCCLVLVAAVLFLSPRWCWWQVGAVLFGVVLLLVDTLLFGAAILLS